MYLAQNPDDLFRLDPRRFEELVAELLAGFGWSVQLTPQTRDGGLDIFAISRDLSSGASSSWVIQCKRNARHRKVGIDIARELFAVKSLKGASSAMIVTTSSFTEDVVRFQAGRWDIDLRDHDALVDWLRRYRPEPHGKLWIQHNKLILPCEK